jgi:serine/threonine protein kinase
MSDPRTGANTTPAIGRGFGKYELLGTIGGGGMATVYRACLRGPAGAARPVALKLIHAHLSQEQSFVRMFLDETRVAMALSHRNIVQTFDAGVVGGRHYLAMELVSGLSLREVFRRLPKRSRIPVDVALFVAMEVCSALAHAHGFRPELTGQPGAVIHRDVSPSNILLSVEGDVRLVDFGVARARDQLSAQTTSGVVKGKLCYMAPEQARGRAEPRSDLFAVGVVLYEMLSGRVFRNAASLEEVFNPPSIVPLHVVRPETPLALEQLVLRTVASDPTARPASAEELRAALAQELLRLQLKDGRADSHARLREFLASLPEEEKNPQAERLAEAMIREALEVAPGDTPLIDRVVTRPTSEETLTQRSRPPPAPAATASETTVPRTPRWPFLLAAIGLLLAGGAGTAFWLSRSGEPSALTGGVTVWTAPSPTPGSRDALTPGSRDAGRTIVTLQPDAHVAARRKGKSASVGSPTRPAGKGLLDVNCQPWARVTIGGRYRGDTPIQGLELPAGSHRVRLENPTEKRSTTITVKIVANQTTTRVVTLPPTE